jgi:hypothetical protein
MVTMSCQTCRFEIEELGVDERLGEGARAHLSSCSACSAFHDERQSLKRLVGSLAQGVSAPPDFDFRLRARIHAAKQAGRRRPTWLSFITNAPAIGLAATFALLVAGVVIYKQTRRAPSPVDQPGVAAGHTPQQGAAAQRIVSQPLVASSPQVSPPASADAGAKDDKQSLAAKVKSPRVGGNNKYAARRESPRPGAVNPEIVTNETAVRPAPQILPGTASPLNAGMNQVVELPVRPASQPMRVFVNDRSGAKRRVTLAPVTFGSQDFAGLDTSRLASSQGIW